MRDYLPNKNNEYLLPRTLYRLTLALIRDYERRDEEYNSIAEESPPPPDGQPKGTKSGNPTERNGIRCAEKSDAIKAIDDALGMIPEEYREGVWYSITQNRRYPDDADPRTYSRYKQKFIYLVAHKMFWI